MCVKSILLLHKKGKLGGGIAYEEWTHILLCNGTDIPLGKHTWPCRFINPGRYFFIDKQGIFCYFAKYPIIEE